MKFRVKWEKCNMEPMLGRMRIWDYKIKYCMKVSSKTALGAYCYNMSLQVSIHIKN
jgi:hypothetical protein